MPEKNGEIPPDRFTAQIDPSDQQDAAYLVQDAFSCAFRLTVGDFNTQDSAQQLGSLQQKLEDWVALGKTVSQRAARQALLITGLDQWGVAWCGAFTLVAIPGLSELVRRLRTRLSPVEEANFLQQFEQISASEYHAIDFKIVLRRTLHLTLWHCMIAAEDRDEALRLATYLGSVLFSLTSVMPETGWRLIADAVAHIQLRCLADGLATEGIPQEATQALFAALNNALPSAERDNIMAHATQAVITWRQSQRPH